MCFKENYCMIQQGSFILLSPGICCLEWLLRRESTMKWAVSTEMAKSKKIPTYLESLNIFV